MNVLEEVVDYCGTCEEPITGEQWNGAHFIGVMPMHEECCMECAPKEAVGSYDEPQQ